MEYWTSYQGHSYDVEGRKNKFDTTIYSFDIETTSYIIHNGEVLKALDYDKLTKKEQELCTFGSYMYIWQFSINNIVYYGRTWKEFKQFINKLEENTKERKIIFVHNLSFEFQFLQGEFDFTDVVARKSHKVMKAIMKDYNIEFRCSYMMSNCTLAKLPDLFNLPVEKMLGDLDYNVIRTSDTELTPEELKYCENDCLVIYYYIKYEIETYDNVNNIPLTSTGHVRRELKSITRKDLGYKRRVRNAVNTDPHIYNLLIEAFAGGFTHANWLYTSELIKNVDSWDFTSSYPYVMVTHRFPSTKFLPCRVKRLEDMRNSMAYLLVVKFTNLKSKYYNTFISMSKCREISNGLYDNGRVVSADELTITVTDIDFKLFLESYTCEYEILECYYSVYNYLPKQFINFILDKYVIKTTYKGIPEKEIEYQREKGKFNSLYGMSVTNNIRDEVQFDNNTGWSETPISNEDIIKALKEEEKDAFLSFAYGVWVTAYARNNLLKNVMKLDEYVVYCDTDSIKVKAGYDKTVIDNYNEFVKSKINHVSELLEIPYERFAPKDIKGKERMLGLFDDDGHYDEFITQGAKKYAIKQNGEIHITVSGVPKKGSKALHDLNDFKDNFIFRYEDTGKQNLIYCDNQESIEITDYQGHITLVSDNSGCCIVPTTYELGKSEEYMELLNENSSERAIYNENM